MKFKRSFILILILLCSSIGMLAGCGDKFSKLSATIDKQEVNVYFEEADNKKTSEQITVSLHNLPKDSSAEIYWNIDNPNVANISIQTDEDTNTSVISVSPNMGGSANLLLIHKDSNKKLGEIKINAIREVKSIEQQDFSVFALVSNQGDSVTYLDSGSLISYSPTNTTQKDIVYSIANEDALNGVSVTPAGALTVLAYPSSGYVYVTATVKDTNISTKLKVKVLNPILKQNITVQILKDGHYETLNTDEELIMINNRATSSEHTLKTLVNYSTEDEVEVSYEIENNNLVATQMINSEELMIITGQSTGITNLAVNVKVKGYLLSYTLLIPIKVIEVPSNIKVNNSFESTQNYSIYDKYVNSYGKEFNVQVGLSTANSLDYILVVNSQDANKIDIYYESGEKVLFNNSLTDSTLFKIESNKFYVKAKQGYDTSAKILVYALGGIGYEQNPVCTTLNLDIRKSVESIRVDTTLISGILYVEKGTTKTIDFSILNKDGLMQDVYSNSFEIVSSEYNVLENINNISGQTMLYNYSFNITGKNEGITTVGIYTSNGIFATFKVRVFSKLSHFTLTTDSFVDNINIADSSYELIDGTNDKTLSTLAVGLNSIIQLNLNKYNKDTLANNVLVERVEYTSTNTDYVNVGPTGLLFASQSTQWGKNDEVFKYVTVSCTVYYYTEDGVKASNLLPFKVYVFRNINNLQILENNSPIIKLDLYSYTSKLYHYIPFMEKTLTYRINPGYATHYTIEDWTIIGDKTNLNIEKTDENSIKLSSDSISEKTCILQISVKQFNKRFYQNVQVNIIPITEITDFSNVYYQPENSTKQYLRSAGDEYAALDPDAVKENCLGEIYLDYRDIDNSTNIYFNYSANNSTFKDVELHIQSLTAGSKVINKIDENNFSVLSEGLAKIYLVPLTKFVDSKEINETISASSKYVYVKVAGGSTQNTALELTNVSDLIRMNALDSLQTFRYYTLKNNIDVSSVRNWNGIGSTNNLGFSGVIKGNNYKITGINLNSNNYEGQYYGFITKLNDSSLVSDLSIEIENFNLTAQSADKLQTICVGGLSGFASLNVEINNVNVTLKNCNIVLNYRTGINFGSLVGNSQATIRNSKVINSNILITKQGTEDVNNKSLTFNIGGLVGLNDGTIQGLYNENNLEDLFLKNNLDVVTNIKFVNNYKGSGTIESAIGGLVGLNNNVISNISVCPVVNCNTTKANNVGGLVGLNNANISNVVVILKNNLEKNEYLSAVSGCENVGGLVGSSNASSINKAYVFALDNSNYFSFKGTIYPQILGVNNVGGLIGTSNNVELSQSYISSYFKRELSYDNNTQTTYLGTIGLSSSINNNMAGLIANANGCTISECFANIDICSQQDNSNVKGLISKATNNCGLSNFYAIIDTNIESFDALGVSANLQNYYFVLNNKLTTTNFALNSSFTNAQSNSVNQINKGQPVLTNVKYIGQPSSIQVSIKDDYKIKDSYGYLQTGLYNFADIISYNSSEFDSFINIFSSDDSILTYNNGTIDAKTGNVVAYITSLLNNTLQIELNFKIIDKIDSNSFNIYDTLEKKDENSKVNSISLDINSSKDLFVDIRTNNEDYFKKDEKNNFVYSANDLLLKISCSSITEPNFTVNGLQWQGESGKYYVIVNPSQKITIIASDSENAQLLLQLVVYEQIGNEVYYKEISGINAKTIDLIANYKITDVVVNTSGLELDAINNADVKVIVKTDKTNLDADDVVCKIDNIASNITNNVDNVDISNLFVITNKQNTQGNQTAFDFNIKVNTKDEAYLNLTTEVSYKLTIIAQYNSQVVKKQIEVVVKPQQVEKVSLDFYSNGEMVKKGTENMYTISEVPSNNLIAGSMGILKIHTYPENTQIEQVKLQYSTNTPYQLQLSQMLLVSGTVNSENKKYYTNIKPNAIAINNGIQFTKTYAYATIDAKNNNEIKALDMYDGYLFAGVSLGSSIPENNEFTLTATVITTNKKVYTQSITLKSVLKSEMTIENNNVTGSYFAIGTEKEFTIKTTKLIDNNSQQEKQVDNIIFTLKQGNSALNSVITTENGKKTITFKNGSSDIAKITLNAINRVDDNICNISYKFVVYTFNESGYTLSAQLTRISNGLESVYQTESDLIINTVYYTIESISLVTEDNSNVMRLALGQTLPLKVKLNLAYNEESLNKNSKSLEDNKVLKDLLDKLKVDGKIVFNNLSSELSNTVSQTAKAWYTYTLKEGSFEYNQYDGSDTDLDTDTKLTYFKLRTASNDDVNNDTTKTIKANDIIIQGTKVNTGSLTKMSTGFWFNYQNGVPVINYSNIYSTETTTDLLAKLEFNVYVYDSGDLTNAVPISTEEELLSMEEGGYYRLTNNITIEHKFTPLTTKVACLDGNGWTITLKQGFDESVLKQDTTTDENGNEVEATQPKDVNLGLFESLDENMRVYSLTVELPYLINEQVEDEEGNLTDVINNFENYNLGSLNIGYIAGLNNGTIYNCKAITTANTTDSTILTNTSTTLNFGGIAGENGSTGFITNSRSNVIAKFNRGNVGGVVGTNNNVIASSYFQSQEETTVVLSNNPQTEENSSLGGFVAINNGQIRTSYVEGNNKIESSRYQNGYLQSSISIGGFVSKNNGSIEDCYTNIPIYGNTQTSGFVFENAGTITRCLSYSQMIKHQDDHTPFVGTRNAGKQVLNTGTIVDSYYLKGEFSTRMLSVSGVTRVESLTKDTLTSLTFGKNALWEAKEVEQKVEQKENEEEEIVKNKIITLFDANDTKTYQVENKDIFSDNESQHIWDFASKKEKAPYVVASAEDFNKYFEDSSNYETNTGNNDGTNNNDGNPKENEVNEKTFGYSLRIVRDLEFSKEIQPSSAIQILDNSTIQGNGMTLNNIYLIGDGASNENYGLFKKITNSNVNGLNLVVARLYSNKTQSVGALAGKIENSNISNVSVATNTSVIQGINLVGGLAGTVANSNIEKISVQANVNAGYFKQADKITNISLFKEIEKNNNQDSNKDNKDDNQDKKDKTYTFSYAGSLIGVVLDKASSTGTKSTNTVSTQSELAGTESTESTKSTLEINNDKTNINNVSVNGINKVSAYYAGGVIGYLGKDNAISNVNVAVDKDSYIVGKWISGGIIAHANGSTINNAKMDYSENADKTNVNFFRGSPKIIAGIVGIGNNATIENCTNNITTSNEDSTTAGGIIGVMIYGKVSNNKANCDVTAITSAGGIIGSLVSAKMFGGSTQWFNYTFDEKNGDTGTINGTYGNNFNLTAESTGSLIGSYENYDYTYSYEKDGKTIIVNVKRNDDYEIPSGDDEVGEKTLSGSLDSFSPTSSTGSQETEGTETLS